MLIKRLTGRTRRGNRRTKQAFSTAVEQCELRLVLSAAWGQMYAAAYESGGEAADAGGDESPEAAADYSSCRAAIEAIANDAWGGASESEDALEPAEFVGPVEPAELDESEPGDAGVVLPFGGASLVGGPGGTAPTSAASDPAGSMPLAIDMFDVAVTSSGIEISGSIFGGGRLDGHVLTISGAISASVTTASDGTFSYTHYGSASGLISVSGLDSPFIYWV